VRTSPSDVCQLQKLATKIRSDNRRVLDMETLAEKSFKRACGKTGGGVGEKPPEGNLII